MKTSSPQGCALGRVFHHTTVPGDEDPDVSTVPKKINPLHIFGLPAVGQFSNCTDVMCRMPIALDKRVQRFSKDRGKAVIEENLHAASRCSRDASKFSAWRTEVSDTS